MTDDTEPETISIVIPVLNEAESLTELTDQILRATADNALELAEIVFVDDGSTDESWSVMRHLSHSHGAVKAVRLRRNFGKAAALNAGISVARGSIIVTMDADLQDDPVELPRFIEQIGNGFDLVSGWKKTRRDPLSKTLPSRLFNLVTARVTGTRLHDFNCGYKAYRREIFNVVQLYGELHRYIPVLAHALGYRIGEIAVTHHARRHGKSKYGMSRFLRGFLDLLTVVTITRYAWRPGHLFGGVGAVFLVGGSAILSYLTGLKLITGADIGSRPLLLLGVMTVIIGVQLLLFGMMSELINSKSSGTRPEDLIRETILDGAADQEPAIATPRVTADPVPAPRAAVGGRGPGSG
ncbi:MAG: glycosyltransferase family 2 protein [Alphaproteobacteria bacterium]